MSSCLTCNFCLLWHWHTIFGTLVYHHERMCQVHSWSWYDIDLWPQGQIYRVYDMALCSGLSIFVFWHSHTLFGTWVYHHGTMCHVHSWTLYDLDLWPQYQNYIFTMDLSLARCLCSLTKAYQILAYGCITMRKHVEYILYLSMTLTFDLYVGGGEYPFWVLLTIFILFILVYLEITCF